MTEHRTPHIALVSSVGGHLTELLALRAAYADLSHFYVFNDQTQFTPPPTIRMYTVAHAERDLRVLSNVWEFFRIFKHEQPTAILTTGAGLAVSAAVAAKFLGISVIFVETVAAVTRPSLTGVLIEPWADTYFVQWKTLTAGRAKRWSGNVFGCS